MKSTLDHAGRSRAAIVLFEENVCWRLSGYHGFVAKFGFLRIYFNEEVLEAIGKGNSVLRGANY